MNDLKADGTPFWYGVYKISDKTLQTCIKKDSTNGVTTDNSQNAHIKNEDGTITFVFSSIIRGTKQEFLDALASYQITNPDEIEIPD
jgi:hypothetical protein